MIKLKKLLKEDAPGFNNRQFGDSLPTLTSVMKNHSEKIDVSDKTRQEKITEASVKTGWKLYHVYDINSKLWREMKYDLRDQFDELVKIGEDYGVFQNAQGTFKALKQIKRIMDKI